MQHKYTMGYNIRKGLCDEIFVYYGIEPSASIAFKLYKDIEVK